MEKKRIGLLFVSLAATVAASIAFIEKKRRTYVPEIGEGVEVIVKNMVARAWSIQRKVHYFYNNLKFTVTPGMLYDEALEKWGSLHRAPGQKTA